MIDAMQQRLDRDPDKMLLKTIGLVIPLRVEEDGEREGLDIALHGESVT